MKTEFDYSKLLTPKALYRMRHSILAARYDGNECAVIDTDNMIALFIDDLSPHDYKNFDREKAEDFLLSELAEMEKKTDR